MLWQRAVEHDLARKPDAHVLLIDLTDRQTRASQSRLEGDARLAQTSCGPAGRHAERVWLLRQLELDHYLAQSKFIAPRAAKIPDPNKAKAYAKANIPTGFTQAEQAAMRADIDKRVNDRWCYRRIYEIHRCKADSTDFPLINAPVGDRRAKGIRPG